MDGAVVRCSIVRGSYRDSVELMGIAARLEAVEGVERAGLMMATPANLAVLSEAGLRDPATDGAGPNDLVVAVAARDAETAQAALARADALLREAGATRAGPAAEGHPLPATIGEGLAELPEANLVLISTPGAYATAEALKALKHGLNVFLFSDNVPIEDEIELKTLARRKGLLLMGPDCGTAIVSGVPLGFANAVARGPIGLLAASGTGLQQVTCLIDRLGSGVSHAIGLGGRDLDGRVGGPMMLAGLERLAADDATTVVVLISKPPAEDVAARVLETVRGYPKPVVVNFIGGDPERIRGAGAHPAATFEETAVRAVALAAGAPVEAAATPNDGAGLGAAARAEAARLAPGQTRIRGLFSGGSLAGEAKLIIRELLGPQAPDRLIDLGDDEYTVGRPHPMIDPRLRNEFIADAARDPEVAVVLLDVVLGYGAHPDPAGALLPAIAGAQDIAAAAGRGLTFIASVCGTSGDPQGLNGQESVLVGAGVLLAGSNAGAARLAARIAAEARTRGGRPAVAWRER